MSLFPWGGATIWALFVLDSLIVSLVCRQAQQGAEILPGCCCCHRMWGWTRLNWRADRSPAQKCPICSFGIDLPPLPAMRTCPRLIQKLRKKSSKQLWKRFQISMAKTLTPPLHSKAGGPADATDSGTCLNCRVPTYQPTVSHLLIRFQDWKGKDCWYYNNIGSNENRHFRYSGPWPCSPMLLPRVLTATGCQCWPFGLMTAATAS